MLKTFYIWIRGFLPWPLRSNHCVWMGKHVCTYRTACKYLSQEEAQAIGIAYREGRIPRRKLPPL